MKHSVDQLYRKNLPASCMIDPHHVKIDLWDMRIHMLHYACYATKTLMPKMVRHDCNACRFQNRQDLHCMDRICTV